MSYGLLPQGFVPRLFDDLREERNAALRAKFGPSLPLSDDDLLGQLVKIQSEQLAQCWEILQELAAGFDPDQASGIFLRALASITGVRAIDAAPSTADLVLTGDEDTVIAAGSLVHDSRQTLLFATDAESALTLASSWAVSTGYGVGSVVQTATGVYYCTASGISAGSGTGPAAEDTSISDGTVTWAWMGLGDSYTLVGATAQENGPLFRAAFDLTRIVNPLTGWRGVSNPESTDLGRLVETDEELRIRREQLLSTAGTGPIDAIYADMLAVPGVTSCRVFNNPTDTATVDGIPPHAVEIMLQGGEAQDIFDQLLASVSCPVATYGDIAGTALDSQGNSHEVAFSRPTILPAYVDADVEVDAALFPADGESQLVAAIVDFGNALGVGYDIRPSALAQACFAVPGVLGVTEVRVGSIPDPTFTGTIAIDDRTVAEFSDARTFVDVAEVTP